MGMTRSESNRFWSGSGADDLLYVFRQEKNKKESNADQWRSELDALLILLSTQDWWTSVLDQRSPWHRKPR